ncbi:unnamed protein product [Phytophthora lilii]|uniref:Unnamed protein product n=1 Tax=Phytophthora lilii TaxID=2077276 RepID=A0A9W6WNY2_9STRA|nr:unnamed protein product [Phytophthora lilii]
MTSTGSDMPVDKQLGEDAERIETYAFVPDHLRHHFKAHNYLFASEGDNQEEQQRVRQARQTRSAHLVADLFSKTPPPAPAQFLYINAIERALTARMTYARAREGLEKYFNDVVAKVIQLEAQYPNGVFDISGMKIPTLVQTQRQIINVCQGCLGDCDIYIGMYEALPSPPSVSLSPVIRFVACSTKSKMLYQTLECPLNSNHQVPSTHQLPSVGNQHEEEQQPPLGSITVEAMTVKEAIIVDDIADLEPGQIHRFYPNETVGPFSCFPLVSELNESGMPIGVLSVDACRKAQRLLPQSMSVEGLHAFLLRMQLKDAATELRKAKMDGARFLALTEIDLRHKPSFQRLKVGTRNRLLEIIRALQRGSKMHLPDGNDRASQFFTQDDDAIEFLDGISRLSGKFLAHYRRVHWMQEIASVTRNPACTAYDVYDVLIRAITRSIEPLERVAVWKITTAKMTTSTPSWEIDVVASSAVPDDRIIPFKDGLERKFKRIAIYKENEEAVRTSHDGQHTPLLRGGIINVITQPITSKPPSAHACENAVYHLSWSDRSLQSVTWPQLRQLLPIRNMNSKHFQLRQLCHCLLEKETDAQQRRCKGNTGEVSDVNQIKNPNGLVALLRDTSRSAAVKYVLEVDFSASFEPPKELYTFLGRAVAVAENALLCVRGREARHARRKRAVAKNSQWFQSIGLNPSGDALRALNDIVLSVFEDISECLPGVHLQIAELQADGVQLKYTFTGKGSTVLGNTLNRGQGVSFKCLDTKQPVVVGATSELRSRLQRLGALRSQPQAVDAAFPFIFLPLFHEDCAVGVLSVDSFKDVPKGRQDEAHPEVGILDFLIPLSKLLASAIYAKRRAFALYQLQLSCQEVLRSPQQLLFYACRALKDIMVGAWKVRAVEVDGVRGKTTLVYDFSESERKQARSWLFNVVRPMAFRWKELCTDTIILYLCQMQSNAEQSADSLINLLAAIRKDEQEHQMIVARYQQLICDERDAPPNAPRRAVVESEKVKLFEKQTADKYFLLLDDDEGISSDLTRDIPSSADRTANEKYAAHAMKLFLGTTACLYSDVQAMARPSSRLFLTISALPQFHASCDQVYLQRVASITSKYMVALQERVQRSRERTIALSDFRSICLKTLSESSMEPLDTTAFARGGRYQHKLSPAQEIETESLLHLQRETIMLIERTLGSPNVYFGLLEPALRLLRYTSSSKTSEMAGKKLKHGYGVSFLALEKQIPVVVTSQDAANEDDTTSHFHKLRFFTNEALKTRKWPFIVVPLGNLGVLALDNMEAYERKSGEIQPELGVVDFLRKIGQRFAEVLAVTRERASQQRQKLRDEALVRVMSACENFKPTTSTIGAVSLYLPHVVIQHIENALNGVDAYIGMVDPLCKRIRFICASSNSKMESKSVDTTQSVSFRVFANQRTIVIPQLTEFFQQQQLLQQHDSEHGQKLKYFGGAKSPHGAFVCVPVPFVGVLTVDTFPGAAGGEFSTSFPEDGVVAFLEKAANYLGENIRTISANDAKKQLPTLFQGNRTTFPLLFKEILGIISRNLLAAIDIQALRFERSEQTRQWRKNALFASMRRSTADCNEPEAINTDDAEELLLMQNLGQQFRQLSESECVETSGEIITATVPLVYQLPKRPEILVVHCSSTRDVEDDDAALGPTVIVLRRVKGATWVYDEEFLVSILPFVNSLINLVNIRVEGIVARRLATNKLESMCQSLERIPSRKAMQALYSTMLPTVMELLAQAMSRDNCDVYLGQRELTDHSKSRASQLQLRFVAASGRSLMQNIILDLENSDNLSLIVVQSLQHQQSAVVLLSGEQSPIRFLTTKPAQRVYLTVPMGDNYVLCADSLGLEAFVPGKRQVVEPDVVAFLKKSALTLLESIQSTRHRVSYDELQRLTTEPHTDLRYFHSTILDGLRRDLVNIHSQQILTLGADFTSSFRLEAWQRRCTRRPISTLLEHFCSVNGCSQTLVEHEVHFETQVLLPMTNLPRTLDVSRSRMQPVEGTEKHGAFTCACLATMLDMSLTPQGGDAKLALCVFSHDVKTKQDVKQHQTISKISRRAMMPPDYGDSTAFFSNYQRQYFFAFAAVVADVYIHVFRACALETYASELFMALQEYFDAKDGIAVRFSRSGTHEETKDNQKASTLDKHEKGTSDHASRSATPVTTIEPPGSDSRPPVVLFCQQPGKAFLRGKLETKVRQFEETNAPITIFMTKKAAPAPPVKVSFETTHTSVSSTGNAKSKGDKSKTTKRAGPTSLFGGRKLFRYGKKKKQDEEEEKAKQEEQLLKATPQLQALSPSRAQQLRQETVSLHVFIRALDYQGRRDIIAFTIEKQSIKAAAAIEKITRRVKSHADALAAELITKRPRGDEEINASRFCSVPSSSNSQGGGGFLLLSLLKRAREDFQQVEGTFGSAMRQFLTGAQSTARDTHSTASEAMGALFGIAPDKGDETVGNSPTTAILRVALVACGSKRDTIVALSQNDLLKEYLRVQAGKKLLQLDPTDNKVWAAIARARTLLRSFNEILQALDPRPEDGKEPSGVKVGVNLVLHSLLDLLLAQSAVVRYLKHLEMEISSKQRQFCDAPATTLQCFVRQSQARTALKKRRREFKAVLSIQCAFRQHLARRRVLFMKWTRAAVIVQRAYRRKRQRAKGSRPQRFTAQLLSASRKYGAMGRSPSIVVNESLADGAWRTEMAAFGSFDEYLSSKVGKEQVKKEEELMWTHRRQLEKERSRLPRDEALREDVGDLFELLDDAGCGELSRERTSALITRLHVPLNEEEVADVVAMMDSDGSGSISMDEFLRWFAHEFPLLQNRAPRVCGVVTRKDWQWVIQQSARSAILKRWRAMRAGAIATATNGQEVAENFKSQEGAIWEEEENSDSVDQEED